jgi:hypothetical protein
MAEGKSPVASCSQHGLYRLKQLRWGIDHTMRAIEGKSVHQRMPQNDTTDTGIPSRLQSAGRIFHNQTFVGGKIKYPTRCL